MKRFPVLALYSAFVAAIAITGCSSTNTTTPVVRPTPVAAIQHIIVMMQENRSFNNIFAGFPGATTAMEGRANPKGSQRNGAPEITSSNCARYI
jgi:phospholipase C